jgi:hypothetical protein
LWGRTAARPWVRTPQSPENERLARKVFDGGRANGLVEILAVAKVQGVVATTVWYPKEPNEEVQGWDRGLKLAIRDPLTIAKAVWRDRRGVPSVRSFVSTLSKVLSIRGNSEMGGAIALRSNRPPSGR